MPELLHRPRAVVLDRLLGEVQQLRDLAVRVRLGDELDDLLLALGELARAALLAGEDVLDQGALGVGGEEGLAALDRADRLEQLGVGLALEHVSGRSGLEGLEQVALVVVHGEDEDGDVGRLLADLVGRLQPGEARHLDVEDREVGALADRDVARLDPVRRLGDDLHVLLALEEHPQAGADDPVVVGDQDPHRRALELVTGRTVLGR